MTSNDLTKLGRALTYLGGKISEGDDFYAAYLLICGMASQAALANRENLTRAEWEELVSDEEIVKAGIAPNLEKIK